MAHGKRRRDSIHETPDVSYIHNPDVAHEHSDVPVTPLLKFVFGLFVFTLLTCGAVLLMFIYFQNREEKAELRASPLARKGEERLPPEPRLQLAPGFGVTTNDGRRIDLSYDTEGRTDRAPQPQSEYWTVRDMWVEELTQYGWARREEGAVRIPIERAMEMYAAQQKANAPAAAGGQQQQPAAQREGSAPGSAGQTGTENVPAASSAGTTTEQRQP